MTQTTLQGGFTPVTTTTIIQCSLDDLRMVLSEQYEIARKQAEEDLRVKGLADLLTKEELKAHIPISDPTIWRYEKKGLLSAVFIGGRKYYKVSEINALVEGNKKNLSL